MATAKSAKETVFVNMRWSVTIIETPDGPQRVLRLLNQDETEVNTYPLDEVSALEIGRALTKPRVAVAPARDGLRAPGQ